MYDKRNLYYFMWTWFFFLKKVGLITESEFPPPWRILMLPSWARIPQRVKLSWLLVITEVWPIPWSDVEEKGLSHRSPCFPNGNQRGAGPKVLTLAMELVDGTRLAHFRVAGYFPATTQILALVPASPQERGFSSCSQLLHHPEALGGRSCRQKGQLCLLLSLHVLATICARVYWDKEVRVL